MTRKTFGIRHLRLVRPDEQTAARYFLQWHAGDLFHTPKLFPKITSAEIFGNNLPLELEIGCGTGDFLCSLAAREQAVNFVGIDLSLKSLCIAVEKAHTRRLSNIKFIKAPVQLVYPLIVPRSLQAVYLHYPDPCLHPKFRPRRIFNESFLDIVCEALEDGGRLSVMTDVSELFEILLPIIEKDKRFEKTHAERYLVGYDPSLRSRYQSLRERHGVDPLRFEVRKVQA